ncbi:hypothetical protein [Rhodococcus pyridinivorans]|jgi:hypothetical protein|uniref:hypothetical protein n=1 Tax=Rhodococcus pyridinivorans TaxID=103816 RepID=UPI00110F03C5|nr:hypothetical protein [Rhodococcus pyridinivorans]WAL49656.1 hypothetical protein OQN32_26965 [Rhodococcus pyridinivorans]
MLTLTATDLLAQSGTSGIQSIINNFTTEIRVLGVAVMVMMMVVIGVMIAIASGKEGGWRSSIQKLIGVLAAGLVIGGGPVLATYMVDTGEQVTGANSNNSVVQFE